MRSSIWYFLLRSCTRNNRNLNSGYTIIMDSNDDAAESVDKFMVSLEELVSNKSSDDALSLIFDSANEEMIKAASLDILNLVGEKLKGRNSGGSDIDEWHNLESMLEYVVTVSSPREMLIGLLSLLEVAKSDDFFKLIVRLLRTIFLRLPSQRGDTLLCALSEIHDYIKSIPLPKYVSSLDEKEKLLLENSGELKRFDACITAALGFCESLVQEAKECKLMASNERRQELILAVASFLMKLIEGPIAYFGGRHECVDKLVGMLFDLKPNFLFAAIQWQEMSRLSLVCRFTDDSKRNSKMIDSIAIGVLTSLIYDYGVCADRTPKVYSYEYIFEHALPYANALLKQEPTSPFMEIGVKLLNVFSECIGLQSGNAIGWETQRLRNESYEELFLNLINVITYSKIERIRRLALRLFTRFMDYFNPDGQMMVIRLVYYSFEQQENEPTHEGAKPRWNFGNKGICGYLIDYYRMKITKEIESSNHGAYLENLPRSLCLFTKFPRREESDFLENFDQCMAALNLVRYLCIVRMNGRCPGVSSRIFDQLGKEFVEPTRRGLELSKAHYELDLKEVKQRDAMKNASLNSVTIASESDCERVSVLTSAINSFDLMMSLVARVSELLESCEKVQ